MPDVEKVIKGLECCTAELGINQHLDDFCAVCPYKDKDPASWYCFRKTDLMRDALSLLKAQEPRVIQFDEIDNYEVLYLEVRDVETEDGLAPWVKTRSGKWFSPLLCGKMRPDMILSTPEEYGAICRCWTSRPTDEQREAIPWSNG